MKKMYSLVSVLMVCLLVSLSGETQARPMYIGGIKLAIRAKWAITLGDCKDGHGICLSIFIGEGSTAPDIFVGYDRDTDKIYLKIGKKEKESAYFSGGTYEVQEDSPVDPGVIRKMSNFPRYDRTVVIRKGIYKVADDGNYYIVAFDYYLQ